LATPWTTERSTLSLHDALPILFQRFGQYPRVAHGGGEIGVAGPTRHDVQVQMLSNARPGCRPQVGAQVETLRCINIFEHCHGLRSEEHTSELQSRENLVCRLLL